MIIVCSRCHDDCTPVAMVWSDLLQPEAVCCECALKAVDLVMTPEREKLSGMLVIEFIPLEPIPYGELH